MSLLLEAKSMSALIIKPTLILVAHTDEHGWYITSNQQDYMLNQNINRIVSKPNVTPMPANQMLPELHHTLYSN